jgi:outer membrane protein, multidrug efflux system
MSCMSLQHFRLSMLAAALLFAGCRAVGPDYQRPALATAASWSEPAKPVPAASLDPHWWRLFDDPVLDDLQARAVAANQTLRQAVARLDEGRATLRAVVADTGPSTTQSASASRARRSANSGQQNRTTVAGPEAPPLTQNNFRVVLDASYELDLWGRVRRSLESAEAQLAAQDAATQTVLLTLTADVAAHYFNLRAFDAELAVLTRTVALRSETLAVTRSRYEGGLGTPADLGRAEAELANAEAELIDVRRRRALTEHALAALLGEVPARFRVAEQTTPLAAPPGIPAGLPADLLLRRPDIAEAERLAAAQCAEIGVTKASFLPTLRLTGATGAESVELGDLFSASSRVWSFGPSVSLPVFKRRSNRAQLRAAEARYEQAVAQYRQRALVAFGEVENALVDSREYAAQSDAQLRAQVAARHTADYLDQRLQGGLIGYLDTVDAQRSLLQAERALAQTLRQRYSASLQLIKALGGGWSPPAE